MSDYQRYNTRSSKLSWAEVQEIRRLYHEEHWSQPRIARKFNMSGVQIGRIVRGESQRSVPETVDTSGVDIDPNAPAPNADEIAASQARLMEKLANIDAPSVKAEDPLEAVLRKRGGANPLARRPPDPPVGGAVPQVDIEETRTHEQDTHDDS